MLIRIPKSGLACLLAALLSAVGAMAGHAQTASLVADLVPGEHAAAGSDPQKLTAVRGGRVVFEAGEDSVGRELWGSDGTAEGTVLLADICPGGACDSILTFRATFNGVAVLSDYVFGQLWRTDGTREGTFPLRDPSGGGAPLESVYGSSAVFGGFLYFEGCGEVRGCGLWRTDGTPAGTRLVAGQSRLGGEALTFAVTDRAVFFSLYREDFSALLWRTDGTAKGTVRLGVFRDLPRSLTPVGERLFFTAPAANGEELWVSDGTRAGTRPVTSFRPSRPFGEEFSVSGGEPLLFADGDRVDFAVQDGFHGWEVWQSDGTAEGTRPVTDFPSWNPFFDGTPVPLATVGGRLLIPSLSQDYHWSLWASNGRSMIRLHNCLGGCGTNFTGPPQLVVQGEQVLFTSGAGLGRELWITDGTKAGTRKLLDDTCTGDCRLKIELTSAKLDGLAVFRITDRGKNQLWVTDGTAAGTRPLFHLPPGTKAGALPVAAGSKTFFGAAGEEGMELWVSENGAERQVANVASEAAGSYPTALVALGSRLVFQAGPIGGYYAEGSRRALWQSEGTEATTSPILDLFRQPVDCHFLDCLPPMAAAESWLALVNTPRDEVSELWRTDGTAEGTVRLLTVQAPGRIQRLGAFQDTVVFFIESPHHLEIWRSDGTVAGTFQIAHQAGRLQVAGVGGTGTEVYFEIWAPGSQDLWRSDGTAEGTVRVAGLTPGPGPGSNLGERLPIRLGDRVFFAIYGGTVNSEELWSTDGTEEGTVRVMEAEAIWRELRGLDGQLYFVALGKFSWDLWRTDGTAAGTTLLHSWGSMPTSLTVFAGKLFFAAGGDFAAELWSSDGTPAGTGPVLDINPDGGSDPNSFAVFGDHLYFSAFDPEHGYELWQSDGTAGGTRLFQDIVPGILSSAPNQLTVAGDRLYFTAADRATGRELWSLH